MSKQLSELVLTCTSWQQAQDLADHLLERDLVQFVEFLEVDRANQVHDNKQVKLIVQVATHLLETIEAEFAQLQSPAQALQRA